MKHTKGPWSQDKYGTVKTADGKTLVTEGVALGGQSTNETRANARLIAAAPDLLEALKVAEDSVGDLKSLEIVRAAIAKATGETK